MVRAIRNFSINTKLLLLAVVGVVVALAISSGALLSQNIKQIRRAKVEELSALADVLGSNVNAAIEFEDPVTATNLLSSLKQLPSVESAIVYDLKGRVFATYPADWKGRRKARGTSRLRDRSSLTSQMVNHSNRSAAWLFVRTKAKLTNAFTTTFG